MAKLYVICHHAAFTVVQDYEALLIQISYTQWGGVGWVGGILGSIRVEEA
jgi:hypothetical protein